MFLSVCAFISLLLFARLNDRQLTEAFKVAKRVSRFLREMLSGSNVNKASKAGRFILDKWHRPAPFSLPENNIAPENRPSQKENNLPTIHFQVLC